MRTFSSLVLALAFGLALASEAQIPYPAPNQNRDFGSRFFDNLQALFGRLQRSELDHAFQQARPIRCSDLVGAKGEWKLVAFLNDDRSLGDWHRASIDEVKRDLATFVFSGDCRGEENRIEVATSYPVRETVDNFRAGKIPFSQIVIRNNAPVSVSFDQATSAYAFQLPYLYVRSQSSGVALLTLTPPRTTSRQEKAISEEFRCKAISDTDLTYRFLLCRSRLLDRARRSERQPPGNAAYYILSDGKEASASVRLMYGSAAAAGAVSDSGWEPAALQARLTDIGKDRFRLQFNPESWHGRIDKPQLLAGRTLWDFPATPALSRSQYYCVWQPGSAAQAGPLLEEDASDSRRYSLAFAKESESATSVVFDIANKAGAHLGRLQCVFPQSPMPGDVMVDRWLRIVGQSIGLEVLR